MKGRVQAYQHRPLAAIVVAVARQRTPPLSEMEIEIKIEIQLAGSNGFGALQYLLIHNRDLHHRRRCWGRRVEGAACASPNWIVVIDDRRGAAKARGGVIGHLNCRECIRPAVLWPPVRVGEITGLLNADAQLERRTAACPPNQCEQRKKFHGQLHGNVAARTKRARFPKHEGRWISF